ncbi:MAG: hypothetical protein ACRC5T_06880 [Cetobacterium sp.]
MEAFSKKSMNVNDWSVGVVALYTGAEIVSELDYGEPGGFYIFRGSLRKGIRTALDAYYSKGWMLCSNQNPDFDFTEKHKLIEFCEAFGVKIGVRTKDTLCNMEWSEVARLLKEAYYIRSVNLPKSSNVFKFYESLLGNTLERLRGLMEMELPAKVMESIILTFIKKSREWEIVHTNSKKYKLMLKDFKEKYPMMDQLLIQYALKSAKMEPEDRLMWLIINLK